MTAPRILSLTVLLLAACAGWDNSTPSNAPPPAEGPTPSHYAPPPPGDPRAPTATPGTPKPASAAVAIASVQLLGDCPDPAPEAAPAPAAGASMERPDPAITRPQEATSAGQAPAQRSRMKVGPGSAGDSSFRRMCQQSMVQMSVRSDGPGVLKIEGVRILDADTKKVAGPATMRAPTVWSEDGAYTPWDERVGGGVEHKVSYKLGEPDMSRATEAVGPEFNTYMGPFILEVDVSIDGKRQTVRSPEFSREPPHVMVT